MRMSISVVNLSGFVENLKDLPKGWIFLLYRD